MIHSLDDVARNRFLVTSKLREVAGKHPDLCVTCCDELHVSTFFVNELVATYYREGGRRLSHFEISQLNHLH